MGLFDMFQKHKHSIGAVHKNSFKQSVNTFIPSIPQDVQNLLWFSDGENKNIDKSSEEPSAISYKLPLSTNVPEKLGYWPNYTRMSPSQRYSYLEWLTNIDSSTDMGNVFTFFYGLERYIKTSKYNQAIQMIERLKKYHNTNNSFNYYSNVALVYAAMLYKEPKFLHNITPGSSSSLLLIAKGALNGGLNAPEIMNAAKDFNWENTRYIKNNPDVFQKNLENLMKKLYSKDYYPIPQNITDVPMTDICLANISLSSQTITGLATRVPGPLVFSIPDFSKSRNIMTDIYYLLKESHDLTKKSLKIMRKNGNITPKKQIEPTNSRRINPNTGHPMSTDKSIQTAKEMYESTLNIKHDYSIYNDPKIIHDDKVLDRVLPHYFLGDLFYKQGEWDRAEKEWLSIVKLMSEKAATKLAIMYHKENRFKDEISIIKDGIQYGTNNTVYSLSGKLDVRLSKATTSFDRNVTRDKSKGYTLQ